MSELLEDLKNGVLTLTINRPPLNTFSPSLSVALQEALIRAESTEDVRCIALRGAGNVFCAGGDVGNVSDGPGDSGDASDPQAEHEAAVKFIRDGMEPTRILHEINKPTIAIISGAAAGSGLPLALCCDLRFCLDTAKLTTAFSKIGLSGDSGISYFLTQLVGAAKAKELLFTSDVITGKEAYELGLVTKVASKETFEEDAREYAEHIASLPTVALGYIKQNINAATHNSLHDSFDLEAENIVHTMQTEDHKAAAAAFLNKEQAVFKGR